MGATKACFQIVLVGNKGVLCSIDGRLRVKSFMRTNQWVSRALA
jgi:hypothetical protein